VSLAKTLGVLTFTPLTMLQTSAQTVDFKVCRHFGEGQVVANHLLNHAVNPVLLPRMRP